MRPATLPPAPSSPPAVNYGQDDEIRPMPVSSGFAEAAAEDEVAKNAGHATASGHGAVVAQGSAQNASQEGGAPDQPPLPLDKAALKAARAKPTKGLNTFYGRPSTLTTGAVFGGRTAAGRTALTNTEIGSNAYIPTEPGFTPTVAPRDGAPVARFSHQGANQIGREMRTGQDRRPARPLPGLPFTDGIGAQHAQRSLADSIGKQMAAATLQDADFDTHLATLFHGDVAGLNQALRQGPGGTPMPLAEAVVLAHALFLAQGGRPGRTTLADLALASLPRLIELCRNSGARPDLATLNAADQAQLHQLLRLGAALSSSGTGMQVLEHLAGPAGGAHPAWARKSMEMVFDTAPMIEMLAAAPGTADPTRAMATSARATAAHLAAHGPDSLLGPMLDGSFRTRSYPDCHLDLVTRKRATLNWAMRQGFRNAGPDSDLERTRAMLEEVTSKWVDRFEAQAKTKPIRNALERVFKEWLLPPPGTPFTAAGFGAEYSHLQESPVYREKFDRAIIATADAVVAELDTRPASPERDVALAVLRRWQNGRASASATERPHEVPVMGVDQNLATTDVARQLLSEKVDLRYLLDVCRLCDVATEPRVDTDGSIEMASIDLQAATRELRIITDDLRPVNPHDFGSVIEFLQQLAADQRSGATLRLLGGRTGGIDARLPVTLTAVVSAGPALRVTYSDNKVLLMTQGQHGSELFLANSKTFAAAIGAAVGESLKFGEHGILGSTQAVRMLGEFTKAEGVRIRTVRKFTDAGAVRDESRNNNPDYHNALMADVVGLIGRHASAGRPADRTPGDLLDKLAAMDFEGENISVTYQRQQSTDLRVDAALSLSTGYVLGASQGAVYEKTLFSGQSRIDQSGAMQRTVTIHGEASNWRPYTSANVTIPSIPATRRKDAAGSSTVKQDSTVGLTTGRLAQYTTNYGDDRVATHYRQVHMNKKSVRELFYQEIYWGSTNAYEKGLRRNQSGWDSMIGANQVREHIAELRRLQGNRPWNHVARSRMRPEYIDQHEAAIALLDLYAAADRADGSEALDGSVEDLRGFVACLLADDDPQRQVWVPIGLFSTENSTQGRPDRGLNFLAVNTAQNSAYGEREFLFRGASMAQITAAFAQVPAALHPVAPRLALPAAPLVAPQPQVLTAQQMPEGTVSEVTPPSRRSMVSSISSGRSRSTREEDAPNLQISQNSQGAQTPETPQTPRVAGAQFLTPNAARRPRQPNTSPQPDESPAVTIKPPRFTPPPSPTASKSRAARPRVPEPTEG